MPKHTLCIAPMMDYTDRHDRYFLRLISRHVLLYTEMVTTQAILNGRAERLLTFHPHEHPLALQLGGSDPKELAQCARIGQQSGYDEINLNVGCPSDRVKSGSFGACLMATPELVAECVAAMHGAVDGVPVTVKHRIGIDQLDSYEHLHRFVATVAAAGCNTFIVHARKAWLQGLSPKENREIPPLRYEVVYQLKRDFPELEFVINGGIKDLDTVERLLEGEGTHLDGAMIGREAYANPYLLHDVDQRLYGATMPPKRRSQIVLELIDYIEEQSAAGTPVYAITRHILGLYHGLPGAREWRRRLSDRVRFEADWRGTLLELNHRFAEHGL